MKYIVTESDKSLIRQPSLSYRYRILLLDEKKQLLDHLEDFSLDSYTVDGSSDMRRNISITVPVKNGKIPDQLLHTWLPLNFRLQIGVEDQHTANYKWYECGTYVLCDTSAVYDALNNSLSLTLNDCYSRLNGTRNGQIGGSPTIIIPAVAEDGTMYTIQSQLTNFLHSEGITDYIVEELGEFYGIAYNNPTGYLEYRRKNPSWNKMLHDIELAAGCTKADIIKEFLTLCPNSQSYFDIYNNFCVSMIPTCEFQPTELEEDFLEDILVKDNSENISYDIREIKNITEVYGSLFEIDRTAESCSLSGSVYQLTLPEYTKYKGNDYIAFTPEADSPTALQIKINDLDAIPLFLEYTETSPAQGTLQENEMYAVRTVLLDNNKYAMYFLGQYQPHALCVLTDNVDDPVFSKAFFRKKYNCEDVTLREEPGSPFSVQRIGEVLDVKSGEEFDNIISLSVAMENAIHQNILSSSLRDNLQIVTKFLPWLDVNMKIRYKRAAGNEVNTYLIQAVSHQPDSFTSTITMTRFYPLTFQ